MAVQKVPKRIVISHVYSRDNKGDAALTSVLISDLKSKFPGAVLTILALQPTGKHVKFEGVPELPSFMSYVLNNAYHPAVKLMRAFYMIAATFVWAAWFRLTGHALYLPAALRPAAYTYARADLIVPVGGGHIRSQKGLMGLCNVPLLMHPLLFGTILGKATVLYSQSIGPFRNTIEEWLVRFTLKRMTLILLREDTSLRLLARLGVWENVKRSIDSGFLLTSPYNVDIRERYHIPDKQLLIGVTVRSWLKGNQQADYEAAVAKTLDTIIDEQKARVVFIPQVTAAKGDDDRMVSRRVFGLMHRQESATVIEDDVDHYAIKALYSNLDILLGTRFHSVIFSLTSFVPVLAIEYEHKTSGIMHDLGLDAWVLRIEEVTAATLTGVLQTLLVKQEDYRAHLHERIPAYIEEARQTIDLLEAGYNDFVAARKKLQVSPKQ